MADINDSIVKLIALEQIINGANSRMAQFSYDSDSYSNETKENIDGTSDYSYAQGNNIPIGSSTALGTNATTLIKGFRAQASSIPRNLLNHFFGRTSYNLNKAHEWFLRFLNSYVEDIRKNCNVWSPTVPYTNGDVCFFISIIQGKTVARFFCCIADGQSTNIPPVNDDGITNDSIWQECNVFNALYAEKIYGEASSVADNAVTTKKIAPGAVTKDKLAENILPIYRCTVKVHGAETVVPLESFKGFTYDADSTYTAIAFPAENYTKFLPVLCTVASSGVTIYPKYIENGEVANGTGNASIPFGNVIKFGQLDSDGAPVVFGQENTEQNTVTMTVILF